MSMNYIPLYPSSYSGVGYPVGRDINAIKKFGKTVADYINKTWPGHTFQFVCRGSSGSILATSILINLNADSCIIHIKKPGENSHNNNPTIEPTIPIIIVDDFIASGSTLCEIINYINSKEIYEIHSLILTDLYSKFIDGEGKCKLPIETNITITNVINVT